MSESNPTLNVELAQAVYDQITQHPSTHDQNTWGDPNPSSECGTSHCIAGWAMVLSGEYKFEVKVDTDYGGEELYGDFYNTTTKSFGLGDNETYRGVGARLLGLSEDDAETLFYDTPTAEAAGALKEHLNRAQAEKNA